MNKDKELTDKNKYLGRTECQNYTKVVNDLLSMGRGNKSVSTEQTSNCLYNILSEDLMRYVDWKVNDINYDDVEIIARDSIDKMLDRIQFLKKINEEIGKAEPNKLNNIEEVILALNEIKEVLKNKVSKEKLKESITAVLVRLEESKTIYEFQEGTYFTMKENFRLEGKLRSLKEESDTLIESFSDEGKRENVQKTIDAIINNNFGVYTILLQDFSWETCLNYTKNIAYDGIRDYLRERDNKPGYLGDRPDGGLNIPSSSPDPSNIKEGDIYEEALNAIDERCRKMIIMQYEEGLSHEAIADELELGNATNSRDHLRRCNDKVAKYILKKQSTQVLIEKSKKRLKATTHKGSMLNLGAPYGWVIALNIEGNISNVRPDKLDVAFHIDNLHVEVIYKHTKRKYSCGKDEKIDVVKLFNIKKAE